MQIILSEENCINIYFLKQWTLLDNTNGIQIVFHLFFSKNIYNIVVVNFTKWTEITYLTS